MENYQVHFDIMAGIIKVYVQAYAQKKKKKKNINILKTLSMARSIIYKSIM